MGEEVLRRFLDREHCSHLLFVSTRRVGEERLAPSGIAPNRASRNYGCAYAAGWGFRKLEIAERSGCPVERIEELVGLGILVPHDEDGPFSPKDVHRVRLMKAFEDAGIDLDLIARGVASGKLSYENLGLYLPEPAALSQTAEELAAEVGRSPELIARLLREFGVAQPEPDGRLREDEVATQGASRGLGSRRRRRARTPGPRLRAEHPQGRRIGSRARGRDDLRPPPAGGATRARRCATSPERWGSDS